MDIDEVLRRLLLLGLPLVPLACGYGNQPPAVAGGGGGEAGGASPYVGGNAGERGCTPQWSWSAFDVTGSITRSYAPAADWELCADGGDCTDLCSIVARAKEGVMTVSVAECERVDGGDGGSDAASTGDGGAEIDADADASSGDANTASELTLHVTGMAQSCVSGRRPEGVMGIGAPALGTPAGRWLASAAALEAASVPAFRRLARELAAHGAPARLIRTALEAVAEESRHTVLMRRAALARGARPRTVRVGPLGVRPLLAVAVENAREGCVRETLGALTAVHQAAHAADPMLRSAFREIARDESRHARLAWEVDAWARSVLPAREARSLDDARREEGEQFVAALRGERTPPALARELGLPSATTARKLAGRARRILWAA